jgi:hypothetical protein
LHLRAGIHSHRIRCFHPDDYYDPSDTSEYVFRGRCGDVGRADPPNLYRADGRSGGFLSDTRLNSDGHGRARANGDVYAFFGVERWVQSDGNVDVQRGTSRGGVQHFAGDGVVERHDGGDSDRYGDDEGGFTGVVAARHREVATNQAVAAVRLWIGTADHRNSLSNACNFPGAMGAAAGHDAAAVCWTDADILRRWRFGRRRRNCCDRHPSRNIYDHGVCECDCGVDHVDAQYEAGPGRAVTFILNLNSDLPLPT